MDGLGIGSLLVEKHADTAIHPKAVGITTRTMELSRQWGIEERVRAMSMSVDLWHSYFGLDAACAVVLRPDGHIGWFPPASALDRTSLFVEALSSLTGRSVKAALPTTYVALQ